MQALMNEIKAALEQVEDARSNYTAACEALRLARAEYQENPVSDPAVTAIASAIYDYNAAALYYHAVTKDREGAIRSTIADFASCNECVKLARRNYLAAHKSLTVALKLQDEDLGSDVTDAAVETASRDYELAVSLYYAGTLALKSARNALKKALE